MSYKGYLIRQTLTGDYFVERSGQLICWAMSEAHAKELIDEIWVPGGF